MQSNIDRWGVWGRFRSDCYNKLKNNVITASVVNVLARIVALQQYTVHGYATLYIATEPYTVQSYTIIYIAMQSCT